MHDTGEAAEKRPVGSLLPEKKGTPTTPTTPATPATPATVAVEKKCTDDQGEAIWCDGASSVASPVGAVDGVSPPPAELSDAHKKCTDAAGGAIWCTGAGEEGSDAAAPEKKCTDEAGEAIWCDGAPPGTEVIDKVVPDAAADAAAPEVAEGAVVGARAMDAGALNQALSRVMSDPMAGDGGGPTISASGVFNAHGDANAGPAAIEEEDPLQREAEEEAHPDAARQMLRARWRDLKSGGEQHSLQSNLDTVPLTQFP